MVIICHKQICKFITLWFPIMMWKSHHCVEDMSVQSSSLGLNATPSPRPYKNRIEKSIEFFQTGALQDETIFN